MEENLEQKNILLECIRENFDDKYQDSLYKQMFKKLSENNKYFFTITWSRAAKIATEHNSKYTFFEKERKAEDEYDFLVICEKKPEKPKLSKEYKVFRDLQERIGEAWDRNITMEIVFK